jgi:hypothetical protein
MFGDYLDKAPGVDVTEDTIFNTQINAEQFLTSIYAVGIDMDLPIWNNQNGRRADPFSCFTDEGEQVAAWYPSHKFQGGALSPTQRWFEDSRGGRYEFRFKALRKIATFLDRVDDVQDADPGWINQAKGQALFIRAHIYYDMFKFYGGVPIIDHRLVVDVDEPDAIKIPRSSVEETVNFIVDQCDKAAALLPNTWPSEDIGRATKGAALMLKARILLYAASPLSNTGDPVVPLPGHNELICYGNYDVNRWQLAADAAQAVIDWAPSGGKQILTGSGIHPEWGVEQSYFDVWHEPDNVESIMSPKNVRDQSRNNTLWKGMNNFYHAQGGTMVTQNWVEKYEKRDGTPQTWDPVGGDNLSQLLSELDPRFVQSIGYVGSYWNPDHPYLQLWEGAVSPSQPPLLGLKTGYWQRKKIPPEMTKSVRGWPLEHLYRLGEAYLIKAEALNEAQGPVAEAYAAVNVIRARAGMPDFPPGLTKEEFRTKIRNERDIEMYAENHRLWDAMRWLIADKNDPVTGKATLNGDMYGIAIRYTADSTEFEYELKVFESRVFHPRFYHWPFQQNEVNKGYIIQNPGY